MALLFYLHEEGKFSNNSLIFILCFSYGGPKAALAVDVFKFDWNAYLAINKSVVIAYIDGRNSGLKGMKMLFAGYRRLGTVEVWDQINVTRYVWSIICLPNLQEKIETLPILMVGDSLNLLKNYRDNINLQFSVNACYVIQIIR